MNAPLPSLTDWYAPNVKPARVGVYEVAITRHAVFYARWGGAFWFYPTFGSASEAARVTIRSWDQNLSWRGLSADPRPDLPVPPPSEVVFIPTVFFGVPPKQAAAVPDCPPCTGRCNQGRDCPTMKRPAANDQAFAAAHPDLARMRRVTAWFWGGILVLLLAVVAWRHFA